MLDFDQFDTPQRRSKAAFDTLMNNGEISLSRPTDPKAERQAQLAVDAAMSLLRQYHDWLTRDPRP
ncbi:MAG: hypothetical protein Q4B30_08190 [Coriobacteriaceae bacterium]|nr:hypothetical protein [Coriobacteriaceae bacterium]